MSGQLWLSFDELTDILTGWSRSHDRFLSLETVSVSSEGRPVHAITMTDPEADDQQKQHVLMTGLHSGLERSGTASLFRLMEWLLSGDETARAILRGERLVIMPVVNPHGYECGLFTNTAGHDPYTAWTLNGPAYPDQMPEAVAVQGVMAQIQPEIHADVHGLDMSFSGYMSMESSGAAYSNLALRPWHAGIVDEMNRAALEGGFPSDRLEQTAQRLYHGPEIDDMSHKLWLGRPRPFAALYCYHRFHSLISASEEMWDRSGYLRHRRLLEMGIERLPGERHAGYPVNTIMHSILYSIEAYGQTASQRRESRVELWNRLGDLSHGIINPQVDGQVVYVCATSPDAGRLLRSCDSLDRFAEVLRDHPAMDAEPITRLFARYPEGSGQWGDHPNLYVTGGEGEQSGRDTVDRGITLRLRIPYGGALIGDVAVNGRSIPVSEVDGYVEWHDAGFTIIDVNLSPERTRWDDLFVVTCTYDPAEIRTPWRPGESG